MAGKSSSVNVGSNERLATVLAGGGLVVAAITRRSWSSLALAAAGGGLLYRGLTGHCPCYAKLGKNTAHDAVGGKGSLSREIPGHGGVLVEKSVTINKSPDELYAFWRNFKNLPQVMGHLESVVEVNDKNSNWVAKGPAGTTVSWSAEIVRDDPNHYIAWRSLPDADVDNSGSVRFIPAPERRGTEVKVIFEYKPPAGKIGVAIAKLFGEEPQIQVAQDLRRFKELMETGELTTIEGQSGGTPKYNLTPSQFQHTN